MAERAHGDACQLLDVGKHSGRRAGGNAVADAAIDGGIHDRATRPQGLIEKYRQSDYQKGLYRARGAGQQFARPGGVGEAKAVGKKENEKQLHARADERGERAAPHAHAGAGHGECKPQQLRLARGINEQRIEHHIGANRSQAGEHRQLDLLGGLEHRRLDQRLALHKIDEANNVQIFRSRLDAGLAADEQAHDPLRHKNGRNAQKRRYEKAKHRGDALRAAHSAHVAPAPVLRHEDGCAADGSEHGHLEEKGNAVGLGHARQRHISQNANHQIIDQLHRSRDHALKRDGHGKAKELAREARLPAKNRWLHVPDSILPPYS